MNWACWLVGRWSIGLLALKRDATVDCRWTGGRSVQVSHLPGLIASRPLVSEVDLKASVCFVFEAYRHFTVTHISKVVFFDSNNFCLFETNDPKSLSLFVWCVQTRATP